MRPEHETDHIFPPATKVKNAFAPIPSWGGALATNNFALYI
jgi:hypothetical protein